ncbi:MAG: PKD domain-containing protein [Bacteroidota bacterium]
MQHINSRFKQALEIIFVFAFIISCDDGINDPEPGILPVADFIFQVESVEDRATNERFLTKSVNFASTSKDAVSLIWDFGNGQKSTQLSNSREYDSSGTYIVTLTAINSAGISTVTKEVEIMAPNEPVADFELDFEEVNSSLQVNLTNLSVNADEFLWDFGDGNTSDNADLTTYTYSSPGTYIIRLTAISSDPDLLPALRENQSDRKEIVLLDNQFLYGTDNKAWKFKPDSVRLTYDFTLDTVDREGRPTQEVFSIDTLVSSYHVTRADTLFFELLVNPDCMLDDRYIFGIDRSYQNLNNNDGQLIEFGGQCADINQPQITNWQINRSDNIFILSLVGNYIGDSEVGFFYEIKELKEDLLVLEVETTAPNSEELRKVVMAFEPE